MNIVCLPKCKCDFFILVTSLITVGFCKMSVLLFYRRIFSTPIIKIAVKTGLVITVSWTIILLFIIIFQCNPVQSYWGESPLIPNRHCLNGVSISTSQVITDIVLDFSILVMPLPTILNLHLPLRQRLALGSLFLLGLL